MVKTILAQFFELLILYRIKNRNVKKARKKIITGPDRISGIVTNPIEREAKLMINEIIKAIEEILILCGFTI